MKMRSKRLGVWLASLLLLQTVTGPLAVVAQEVPDQEVVATVAPAPADATATPVDATTPKVSLVEIDGEPIQSTQTTAAQPVAAAQLATATTESTATTPTAVVSTSDNDVDAALTQYTVKTTFTINNNPVVHTGKYGEGKFFIQPTYEFPNSVPINVGDTITYTVPNVFQFDADTTIEIKAPDNQTLIGELKTSRANNTATITITNDAYFKQNNDAKRLNAGFTVVWNHANAPLNQPVTFQLEGLGERTLTRIVVDEEPNGISKWGVQRTDDTKIIEWRIRVNRDVATLTDVQLSDVIPNNQELVGEIKGYYFRNWGADSGRTTMTADKVRVTGRQFTVTPGDLNGQGLFLYYQTRIVGPVDRVNKKVYNKVTLSSNEKNVTLDAFAPISVIDASGQASTSEVRVKKRLEGRPLKAGEFRFELYDQQNNQLVDTAVNQADGTIAFKPLTFTETGDYRYTVVELPSTILGVENDPVNKILVFIKVTEDAQGNKNVSMAYDREEFTNTYTPQQVAVNLKVPVTLTGREQVPGEFSAQLLGPDGKVVKTVATDNQGVLDFGTLSFTKVGQYVLTVQQVAGAAGGVQYDLEPITVTVDVVDNQEGELIVTGTISKPGVDNTYTPKPAAVPLTVQTNLTGRALQPNEFEVVSTDENGQDAVTQQSDAVGNATFAPLVFAQAGQYTRQLRLVSGTAPGVTYDTKVVTATIHVTDDKNGQLHATVTYTPQAVFESIYQPAPTEVVFEGTTQLEPVDELAKADNRQLQQGQFNFTVHNEQGELVQTVRHDAAGAIAFEPIRYTQPGVYTYQVRTVDDRQRGIIYATEVRVVTVTVTDVNAQLTAQVDYTAPLAFVQKYQRTTVNEIKDDETNGQAKQQQSANSQSSRQEQKNAAPAPQNSQHMPVSAQHVRILPNTGEASMAVLSFVAIGFIGFGSFLMTRRKDSTK